MSTDTQSPPAQPAKYSRYRSVRRANTIDNAPPPATPEAQENGSPTNTMQRSMSRYRRSRAPTREHHTPAVAPPTPMIPSGLLQDELPRGRNDTIGEKLVNGQLRSPSQPEPSRARTSPGIRGLHRSEERKNPRQQILPSSPEPLEPTLSAAAEDERLRRAHERTQQQRIARQKADEEEAEKILAEQKRKDLERLEATLEAAVSRPISPPLPSSTREKFKFFGRKRAMTKLTPPNSSGAAKETMNRSASHDLPMPIKHGGGGIVPGTDAPVSAVNAGERRVLIRCKQASINLPVTPTTTARELMYSAANVLTNSVSPDAAILLESYTNVGLERRVRRYEHVRDIMNSWDRDTQNALILESSDSPKHDFDLISGYAPKERPGETTVQMYHSQRPGRWIKCHITLLPTGQMFLSKKSGGKMSDKDSLAICHLSDFDIYKPTAQKMRKSLKPPKKICYAIKSQQKATMFLSTENFVHFFCTDDVKVAEHFHTAVQRWRSWYLVNTIGQGTAARDPQSSTKVLSDDTPYTIGSFQPLGITTDPTAPIISDSPPRQVPFHLRHSQYIPPSDDRRKHPPSVSHPHHLAAEDGTFSSNSLLGRTYSQRQRAVKDQGPTTNPDFAAGPFIAGPSLLNASSAPPTLSRSDTLPSSNKRPGTSDGAKVSRSLSTRTTHRPLTTAGAGAAGAANVPPMPKIPAPLLDFTPTFAEPPQWSKEGRGKGVTVPSGVPLVEVARTADLKEGLERKTTLFRRERSTTNRGN